jgi:RNA polymerase sigma-70 factor, ECF subfamily
VAARARSPLGRRARRRRVLNAAPQRPSIGGVAARQDVGVVSDSELIQRTAGGDRSAFELLYRRHSRPVFGLALRRLRDSGRAEDAVQDTFASVWRSARTYRPERGVGSAWLYTVARNAIVDCGRSTREASVAEPPDLPSHEPGPDARAEKTWTQWRVHQAIQQLPERQRTVIELLYWSDLSQSQVAALSGVPLGTVKTRTRGALLQLAKLLEREFH